MIITICQVCKKEFNTWQSYLNRGGKYCSRKCFKQSMIGKRHYAWKGNVVSYRGLHYWIYRKLGSPKKCEKCLKNNLIGRQIQWANKSGKYKRNLKDWIRLCRKCHSKYDKKKKNRL